MGKAEIPEGIRAVATRHRGESSQDRTTDWHTVQNTVPKRVLILRLAFFQEEYEDSSGNVVNKKTYEDLKRQGLL